MPPSDPGEFDRRFRPEHRRRHWPSPWSNGLGTPNVPAIRFVRGTVFGATLVRNCYGLSGCWPPSTDLTGLPANGGFYFQAFSGSVALPAAGYDYNSVWTPLLAGLSPAGMAASLAALVLGALAGGAAALERFRHGGLRLLDRLRVDRRSGGAG